MAQFSSPKSSIPSCVYEIESSVSNRLSFRSRWSEVLVQARQFQPPIAPDDYVHLWERCRDQFQSDNHLTPIWFPNDKDLEASNVYQWMSELGMERFSDFHQWSISSRVAFWTKAIEKLGIKFNQNPVEILNDSEGVAKAIWLDQARLNIAESCFSALPTDVAILSQKPGHPIQRQTYQELRARANQVANSLVRAGCKPGDAIAVVMPMTAWSVAIYLGIVFAGCSVVSIADSFAAPEISTRLIISNAKLVFTYDHQNRAGKKLPLFSKVANATEIPAIVLNADQNLSCTLRSQDTAWTDFLVTETSFDCVDCASNDTINILFSSGTTGDPKAIPWNHTTPIKCAIDGYCHQNIQPGDVCAWPTNLGWMMGPWLIFASLINKATIALYEDAPSGVEFGKFIQQAEVTMLGVVPTIVKAWEASGCMNDLDWSSIKCFSSTGESSQAGTMVFLSALANIKPVIEYCGGTEIGGGYVSSVAVLPNVPAAFNSPAVGLDFLLIDPVDHNLSDQGEVFLVPPSIGLSDRLINRDHFETYYAETPSLPNTPQLRRHGDYFRKFMTDDGPVFEAGGRADDTMNLGGIKISSAEIERVLNQVAPVIESAAVSYSPTHGPDQLIIFAVLSHATDANQLQSTMNQALKTELNPLFKVHSVIEIEAMPRTASGKVMRRKLRDQIA